MSRNVRRKAPVTPAKAAKRRGSDSSSSLNLSDDEGGYSGLDDISDSSDTDEEDVDAVEEQNFRTEALPRPSASRPQPATDEDDDDDDNDDEEEDNDEEIDIPEPDADESASWAGIVSEVDDGQVSEPDFYQEASAFTSDAAVERHVRFDIPSSDSDSTETEEDHADMFPDIFVSQTSLDPAFRREIETDPDESSGSGSFWDYTGEYGEQHESEAEEVIRQLSDDDDDVEMTSTVLRAEVSASSTPVPTFQEPQELDGYETDGDTTEDDTPEPPVRRKSRRMSHSKSEASDSEADTPVKSQRGQPRRRIFKLDRSDKKPIAVLNPITRKMMIFTPDRQRALDLSPEQFNLAWHFQDNASPILSNSANMMLSAMFSSNTFGDLVNTQTVGPAEAFFPFADGNGESSTTPSMDGDEDDGEKQLDISDFITWDDDADDDSSGGEGDGNWEPSSTPARPTTASSDIDVLSHLNPETVGAFRRNQVNQQLILNNQATQDSLAFSGPYNLTALRGLKTDRFDTAGSPLTPARRHRKHASDLIRSPLENVSAKRKASGEAGNSHKKQRSISDVNLLHI